MNLTSSLAIWLVSWALLMDSWIREEVPLHRGLCSQSRVRTHCPRLIGSYDHLSELGGFPLASALSFLRFAHVAGCVLREIKIQKENQVGE